MQDPCVKWLQALERAQEENDLEEESKVSNRLGRVYFQQGDYRAALRFHKRDVYLCECIGKKLGQAIGHRNVGDTYARLSQFGRAKKSYDRYLELSEEIQNQAEIQRAHVVLGNLLFAKAQAKKVQEKMEEARSLLSQAREFHQKSLSLVSSLGDTVSEREKKRMEGDAMFNLGQVFDLIYTVDLELKDGRMKTERKGKEKEKDDDEVILLTEDEEHDLEGSEEVARNPSEDENSRNAMDWFHRALRVYESLSLRESLARTYTTMAISMTSTPNVSSKQVSRAIEMLQKSMKIWDREKNAEELGWTLEVLGATLYESGKYREALNAYDRAFRMYSEQGMEEDALQRLSEMKEQSKNAMNWMEKIVEEEKRFSESEYHSDLMSQKESLMVICKGYDWLDQPKMLYRYAQKLVRVANAICDDETLQEALGFAGLSACRLGRYEESISLHKKEVDVCHKLGNHRGEAIGLCNLANSMERYPPDEVLSAYQAALAAAEECGDHETQITVLENMVELMTRTHDEIGVEECTKKLKEAKVHVRDLREESDDVGKEQRMGSEENEEEEEEEGRNSESDEDEENFEEFYIQKLRSINRSKTKKNVRHRNPGSSLSPTSSDRRTPAPSAARSSSEGSLKDFIVDDEESEPPQVRRRRVKRAKRDRTVFGITIHDHHRHEGRANDEDNGDGSDDDEDEDEAILLQDVPDLNEEFNSHHRIKDSEETSPVRHEDRFRQLQEQILASSSSDLSKAPMETEPSSLRLGMIRQTHHLHPLASSGTSSSSHQRVAPHVVNVKVGSRTFAFPLHAGTAASELTILELMKQLSDRVAVQTGARPTLRGLARMETGAILFEQDVVSHVIGSDDLVVADVAAWTNLPTSSHYMSICKTMGLEASQQIIERLNLQVPYVDLHFPSFGLNDHQFIALLQCLQEEGSLCSIDVSGNGLSDCSLIVLSRLIPQFEYLSSVRIGRNTFGPFGAKALLQSMSNLSHLRVIDLSYAHVTDACSPELSAAVRSSQTSIEELYLGHCFLGNQGILDTCAACQECHALKTLDLSCNDSVHLDDADPSWAACLDDDRCGLRNLHLSGNKIGLPSMQTICRMEHFLHRFSILDFGRCHIGDAGVSRLTQRLCEVGHLAGDFDAGHNDVMMSFSHCHIEKLGSAEIALLVSRGFPLKSLDLSHNIVAESAELLSHSLLQNHWLLELDLSYCHLSPLQCRIFIKSFGKEAPVGMSSCRCRSLSLANNIHESMIIPSLDEDADSRGRGMDVEDLLDIAVDDRFQWKECLREAVHLKRLDLSGNAIDEEIIGDLEKVWTDELFAGCRVGTGTTFILQDIP